MQQIPRLKDIKKLILGVLLSVVFISTALNGDAPKYVFLFIGDGMGEPIRRLPELVTGEPLLMNELPVKGMTRTEAADAEVTDSAAAGTALASGYKTNKRRLGLDAKGNPRESIAEFAKGQGYKVGILSSATLNHATPAAFYAHVEDRGMYDEISEHMAQSGFDFFGGNRLSSNKGSDPAYSLLEKHGYAVLTADSSEGLNHLSIDGPAYVYRKFGYALEEKDENKFMLADLTAKAITVLDNPDGFFMMVEGALIDWRAHTNCAGGTLAETVDFNNAVEEAYKFYEQHPEETLILVTADHDTGGLRFREPEIISEMRKHNPDKLRHYFSNDTSYHVFNRRTGDLRKAGADFDKALEMVKSQLKINDLSAEDIKTLRHGWQASVKDRGGESKKMLYSKYEPFAVAAQRVMYRRLGIEWTTFSHTADEVETTAVGTGAERFSGSYHLTRIPELLREMMKRN